MRFFQILFCLLLPLVLLSQQPVRTIRHGRVLDESGSPVGGACIKNMNTVSISITDSLGQFSLALADTDSFLVVALGYEVRKVMPRSPGFETIVLTPVRFELKTVNIYDFRDWEHFKKAFVEADIPEVKINTSGLPSYSSKAPPVHLRSNEFTSKPTVLQSVISPFSALAYAISGKEKEKRTALERMRQDETEAIYRNIVVADTIRKSLPIKEEHLDDFIIYCNLHIEDKTINDAVYYHALIRTLFDEFKLTVGARPLK